jgi:group I intron endonuclease
MIICKFLLKNEYSNFTLEILEYCDKSVLIKREQFNLDLLKPEYNILKVAGSTLGFKHSESTIEKMKKAKKSNKNHTYGTKRLEKIKIFISNIMVLQFMYIP